MSKRKHTSLKISDKVKILKKLDSGDTANSLAVKYKVGKSTISDIKKNRRKILEYVASSHGGPRNRKSLKLSAYPELEKAVYTWFLQERARGNPVSGELICEKAKYFYRQLYENENFKASSSWLQKFKNRYGIRQRSISGEKSSSKTLAVEPFKMKLNKKIEELNLSEHQQYNADENGLFWKMLPQNSLVHSKEDILTNEEIRESTVGEEEPRERLTDEDILNDAQNLKQEQEYDEEDENTNINRVKHSEAVLCFEKCVKWAQDNGESIHHIFLLEKLQNKAKKMASETIKQLKITDFFQTY